MEVCLIYDYTEWQRDYFDNIPPEKLKADMREYFAPHDEDNMFPNAVRV